MTQRKFSMILSMHHARGLPNVEGRLKTGQQILGMPDEFLFASVLEFMTE